MQNLEAVQIHNCNDTLHMLYWPKHSSQYHTQQTTTKEVLNLPAIVKCTTDMEQEPRHQNANSLMIMLEICETQMFSQYDCEMRLGKMSSGALRGLMVMVINGIRDKGVTTCRGEGHICQHNLHSKAKTTEVLIFSNSCRLLKRKNKRGDPKALQVECEFMLLRAYKETERVKVNCTLEDTLQQASTSGTQSDNALVYDSDGSTEVPKDENCYDTCNSICILSKL
ncbi:hypothetical protein Tco_0199775 [Tanacetum coccineum]